MIPPIIERLVIQGDAQIIQQTVGLSGASTIEVPTGKTIVILNVNLQPLLSLADISANWCSAVFSDWQDYVARALTQLFDPAGKPITGDCLNILELLLNRGITQVELYSTDNRTLFTYTNEYRPMPVSSQDPSAPVAIAYLPIVTEHKQDCYSVHKNQVHIRLRFTNSEFFNNDQQGINNRYPTLISNKDLNNTVPETANSPMDINKQNIFMNVAVFQVGSGVTKLGIFPFANETELNGANLLGQYENNKFFVMPYGNAVNTKPNGLNGELGYFINSGTFTGLTVMQPYQQLFTPYINITYALINEQPSSLQIVSPEKYQTVIPSSK